MHSQCGVRSKPRVLLGSSSQLHCCRIQEAAAGTTKRRKALPAVPQVHACLLPGDFWAIHSQP